MLKIAILGKAGTGKNRISRLLVKQFRAHTQTHTSVKYLALADPIKHIAQEMFPNIPRKHLFGNSQLRNQLVPNHPTLTVRQLLIDIGTWGRSYDPDKWIHSFQDKLTKMSTDIVICPDVRFQNEFDALSQQGFFRIRLYRHTTHTQAINHISETGQDIIPDSQFDYILHNNKPIKDIKQEITTNIIPLLI